MTKSAYDKWRIHQRRPSKHTHRLVATFDYKSDMDDWFMVNCLMEQYLCKVGNKFEIWE